MDPSSSDRFARHTLTRRRFLGLSLSASATAAAVSVGLPAAASAFGAPTGLTATRRVDCLALAGTVSRQTSFTPSGLSAAAAVDALEQTYIEGDPVYRSNVETFLDALETSDGVRYSALDEHEREAFLRRGLRPRDGGLGERGTLIKYAAGLVGRSLVVAPGWSDPNAFARSLLREAA